MRIESQPIQNQDSVEPTSDLDMDDDDTIEFAVHTRNPYTGNSYNYLYKFTQKCIKHRPYNSTEDIQVICKESGRDSYH